MVRALDEAETVEAKVGDLDAPAAGGPGSGPAAASSTPSTRTISRYELLFELARGGMGSVHVGRVLGDHGFDRLVAIKLLPKDRASDEDFAAFAAEARITARINHPNVVDTFEFGLADGVPFLAMQLIEGVPLSRLLEELALRDERLDPDLVAWIGSQAALGLHAAHELASPAGESLGIVHRDVSPQNLLLSFEGRVYVADFGVAKLLENERATASGVIKGKFSYMSPEQTRAERVDRRSDLFSLGAVLHEALTGKALFSSVSPAESVFQINNLEPPELRSVRADVPDELSRVIARCLARKREQRFDSAREVADTLRASLRARKAVVDEGDLSSLLATLFAEERARLRARVRAALDTTGTTSASDAVLVEKGAASEPPEVHRSHGSVTATVGVPGLPKTSFVSRRWIGLAMGAAAVIALVAWLSRSSASSTTTASATAASSTTAAANEVPKAAPVSPALPGAATSTAHLLDEEALSPTTTPSAVTSASHPSRPRVPPAGSAHPSPLPSAAAPSHKGEPFRGL